MGRDTTRKNSGNVKKCKKTPRKTLRPVVFCMSRFFVEIFRESFVVAPPPSLGHPKRGGVTRKQTQFQGCLSCLLSGTGGGGRSAARRCTAASADVAVVELGRPRAGLCTQEAGRTALARTPRAVGAEEGSVGKTRPITMWFCFAYEMRVIVSSLLYSPSCPVVVLLLLLIMTIYLPEAAAATAAVLTLVRHVPHGVAPLHGMLKKKRKGSAWQQSLQHSFTLDTNKTSWP